MKFEINADELKKRIMTALRVATKFKAELIFQADSSSLHCFVYSDSVKAVVKFTDDDLKMMKYKCHSSGTIAGKATVLVQLIPLYSEKSSQIIIFDNEDGGFVVFSERNSQYPFGLIKNAYHWQPELQYTTVMVNRKTLQECIKRLSLIKSDTSVKDKYGDEWKYKSCIQLERNDRDFLIINNCSGCVAIYAIENLNSNMSQEVVAIGHKAFVTIQRILSALTDDEISIGIGDSKFYVNTAFTTYEFTAYAAKKFPRTSCPSDFHYQLNTKLQEWSFVKNYDDDDYTEVIVDYVDGCVEYSFDGENEGCCSFPIEYEHNMKYYSKELLQTVPTKFSCSSEYISKMLKLGKEGERITMYFGEKHPIKRKTVLVEYPVKGKSQCQMSYVFVTHKENENGKD